MPLENRYQIILEPKPDGPEQYAGPIDIEYDKESIPITAPVDIDAFLAGDPDPCQIVAKIPVGWSANGYYIAEGCVRDMAKGLASGLTGGMGHVPKDVEGYEFPDISAFWVGAIYDEARKAAYIRGYIDPAYPELKRHVRSGVVNRVSSDILVTQSERDNNGNLVFTGCVIRSLDFAPRLRNGFQAPVEAQDMTSAEAGTSIHREVIEQMGSENKDMAVELTATEVDPGVVEPGIETPQEPTPSEPTLEEQLRRFTDLLAPLGEHPEERIKELLELEAGIRAKEAQALHEKVVQDLVKGEDARVVMTRLVPMDPSASEETYRQRITDCLSDPALKRVLTGRAADQPIKASTGAAAANPGNLAIKVSY